MVPSRACRSFFLRVFPDGDVLYHVNEKPVALLRSPRSGIDGRGYPFAGRGVEKFALNPTAEFETFFQRTTGKRLLESMHHFGIVTPSQFAFSFTEIPLKRPVISRYGISFVHHEH